MECARVNGGNYAILFHFFIFLSFFSIFCEFFQFFVNFFNFLLIFSILCHFFFNFWNIANFPLSFLNVFLSAFDQLFVASCDTKAKDICFEKKYYNTFSPYISVECFFAFNVNNLYSLRILLTKDCIYILIFYKSQRPVICTKKTKHYTEKVTLSLQTLLSVGTFLY